MVRAICFPYDDSAFVGRAHEAVQSVESDEPLEAAIQALLRTTYPLAVVKQRLSIADIEGATVLYIFRDGRVVASGVDQP